MAAKTTAAKHTSTHDSIAQSPSLAASLASRYALLSERGEIVLEPVARAHLPPQLGGGPLRIELDSGKLTASVAPRAPDEPLSVVTPHVTVIVVGTRFSVAVDNDTTTVAVEQGRVRVERARRAAFLDGGQTLRSDDALLLPANEARLGSGKPPRCSADRHSSEYARCLRRVARGRGIAAENALVRARGVRARAGRWGSGRARSLVRVRAPVSAWCVCARSDLALRQMEPGGAVQDGNAPMPLDPICSAPPPVLLTDS